MIEIVALTEDTGADAEDVLDRVLRHALGWHDPLVELKRVAHAPGVARIASRGGWKNQHDGVSFSRAIVTQLLLGRVVVVHYDADEPWSKRPSESVNQFAKHVGDPVDRAFQHRDSNGRLRLVEMVPYTMIESWAFRDLERASMWSHGDPLHAAAAADPAVLEETAKIKKKSPLKDSRNKELLNRRWPADEARKDCRSFLAFCNALELAVVEAVDGNRA